MTKLRPIGEYIETDVNGYLKNCASKKNISSPWKEAVSDLVDAYVENTPNIQAVYLRGSVPAGTAIKGVSDIDCFAILDMSEEKLQTIDLSWIEVQKAKLREKHPFVTKFEFWFLSRENIDFIWKFIIKTQSVCLWGVDISGEIPPMQINKNTATKLCSDLEEKIDTVIEKLRNTTNQQEISEMTRWICKHII